MNYIKVAQVSELTEGRKQKVTLGDRVILLSNIKNSFYAVDNTCPHMGGSLYDGQLEGSNITCPRHGSVFDVTTGKAVQSGKLLFIKVKIHDLQTYPVKLEGNDVLIGIED